MASNAPFPKIPSSTKTRPVQPLTRSKTTVRAAATTCSLNLAPDESQLTYAKAIRGDDKAQWRKAEEEEFDRLFLSKSTEEAAEHLISALRELYEIKIDWTGAKYIGFTILFNREQKTVTLSMPAYIAKVLERFAHQYTLHHRTEQEPSLPQRIHLLC